MIRARPVNRSGHADEASGVRRTTDFAPPSQDALVQVASPELVGFLLECARGPIFVLDVSDVLVATNSAARKLLESAGPTFLALLASGQDAVVETPLGPHRVVRRRIATGEARHLVMFTETYAANASEVFRVAVAHWSPTARQTEVLRGLLEGQSNKEIAKNLGASYRTVEVHVTALLIKAGVDTRTRLIARARSLVSASG